VNDYLIIKHLNGNVVHTRGYLTQFFFFFFYFTHMVEFRPVREWLNRLEHETIKVEKLLQLKSSQMIVVYSKDNKSNSVERRLIQGPCVFMPQPNEW
jgi:hypothetical protein